MRGPATAGLGVGALALACAALAPPSPACEGPLARHALPAEIGEASGLAVSVRHPRHLWVHNDGREGVLYLLELPAGDDEARIVERVRLSVSVADAEDLAPGPCRGTSDPCLYLADTGDNRLRRPESALLVLREPERGAGELTPERIGLILPDGPRDIEAIAVTSAGRVLFVSKGGGSPPTVYGAPAPLDPEAAPTRLEEIARLAEEAVPLPRRVTGAAAVAGSPDLVWVRTYEDLRLYRVREAGPAVQVGDAINLRPLAEPQGEAVASGPDGLVYLASEAGPFGGRGGIVVLRCGVGGDA